MFLPTAIVMAASVITCAQHAMLVWAQDIMTVLKPIASSAWVRYDMLWEAQTVKWHASMLPATCDLSMHVFTAKNI